MTITVIGADTQSGFHFAAKGDSLVILAGGDVAPRADETAILGHSDDFVTILGTAIGPEGFVELSGVAVCRSIILRTRSGRSPLLLKAVRCDYLF